MTTKPDPIYWEITCNGEAVGNVFFDHGDAVREMDKLNANHPNDVRFVRALYDHPAPAPAEHTEHTAAGLSSDRTAIDDAKAPAAGVPDVDGLQRYAINCKFGAYEKSDTGFWVKHRDVAPALAALQAQLTEANIWKIPVAEEMFGITTCIQTGEERAIPAIWKTVETERNELRGKNAQQAERMEELKAELRLVENVRTLDVLELQRKSIATLKAKLAEAVGLIERYAKETPLGHQPHMIHQIALDFIAKAREVMR